MKRQILLGSAVVVLGLLAWGGTRYLSGVQVPAYTVTQAPLVQQVVATGRVVPVSTARIGAELTGVVRLVHVDESDTVAAGQPLLELHSDELLARVREADAALQLLQQARRPQAQARLRQAQANLDQARREAERRRRLIAANAVPRETLEQAEQALASAQANAEQARLDADSLAKGATEELILRRRLEQAQAALEKATVRSPAAGIVLRRMVEPGDLVQPGKTLLELASSIDGLEVLIPLDERNLGVLQVGQPATCIADAYPQRPFSAEVKEIAPAVDPQRGTVDVRLRVQQPPDFLRADMTVTATIHTGRRDQALIVPNDALFNQQANMADVWLARDGRARPVQVRLGLRGTAFTEVLDGVQSGDAVLLQAGLESGQRVRAVQAQRQDTSARRETPMKLN